MRICSTFLVAASVRSSEDASGSCTAARKYPLSSSGMKPPGMRPAMTTASTAKTPTSTALRKSFRTRMVVIDMYPPVNLSKTLLKPS